MARKPDVPCARCESMMWGGSGSLPPGRSMCQPCRRIEPQRKSQKTPCADCGCPSLGICCRSCRDIRQRGGKTSDELLAVKRALSHRRLERDRQAPGLTLTQRKHLRAKWIKQRRTCTYCPALAAQVDHVIPLALGGTNYIGNLAPACAQCNRAKSDNLLIEWRTGKKARRIRWAIEPLVRTPRPEPKPKFSKVYFGNCVHCETPFAGRNNRVNTCVDHRCWAQHPRPRTTVACGECGVSFSAFSATYCSPACAKRARRKGKCEACDRPRWGKRWCQECYEAVGLSAFQNQTAA